MNPFTIRTGRPGGPRIGDILEDGAGNRALVIDEPGTMDPGMVDRRYIVSVDDPENFTFVGDVRIVGNIANHKEAAMSTPTPRDYGAYDRAIERAVDATQALRQAAADLTAVRKALDPHRQSVPPDSECQRSETDVEVVERLVMERAEWENTSHHVSESAQHWTRSFNKIMAEIGWPHGSGEPCTECILEWIRKHKDADSDSAILLGLRAAAILTADHDCGEEHDAALEVLQAKIEALTADGARSMVGAFSPRAYLYTDGEAGTHREWAEADAQREEATGQDGLPGDIKPLRGVRLANMVESWASAEPVGDLWNAIHHSEIAEWPDPAPASHTASAGPGLTISVPNDAVYQSAKVGDVLRRIYNGTTLRASIVKTEDGVKVVDESSVSDVQKRRYGDDERFKNRYVELPHALSSTPFPTTKEELSVERSRATFWSAFESNPVKFAAGHAAAVLLEVKTGRAPFGELWVEYAGRLWEHGGADLVVLLDGHRIPSTAMSTVRKDFCGGPFRIEVDPGEEYHTVGLVLHSPSEGVTVYNREIRVATTRERLRVHSWTRPPEVDDVPPLHPGQYVATKEEFDAACHADTYTETHTVGGISDDSVREQMDKLMAGPMGLEWFRTAIRPDGGAAPRPAPKIEVGQVWEDCDGRKAMVTTLPYTVGPDVRFVFMVLTGRIEAPWDVPSSGQRQTAGEYGVIFDGARNIVKANGCKLIAGPGAPWPAK